MSLLILTKLLNDHLEQLKILYSTNKQPENSRDKQFFLEVKDKTGPIFELLNQWEEEALVQGKKRNITLYPQQITSTKENMGLILMHSYYHDVRKRRYMELNQSIQYVFDQVVREMEQAIR